MVIKIMHFQNGVIALIKLNGMIYVRIYNATSAGEIEMLQ